MGLDSLTGLESMPTSRTMTLTASRFGRTALRPLPALLAVLAVLGGTNAHAQFKVVNPDGSVTYTDRLPAPSANARITQLNRPGTVVADPDAALPADLRQAMQRYPVTLYTTSECTPCDGARQLLATRGVPFAERRIATEDDALAFERLFGTRTVPLVTIGAQLLRGLSENEWGSYLDAAGYPRQNKLPRGWQPNPAQPLVARTGGTTVPAAPARAASAPTPAPADEAAEAPASGVRF
jgi:glutaredoxin